MFTSKYSAVRQRHGITVMVGMSVPGGEGELTAQAIRYVSFCARFASWSSLAINPMCACSPVRWGSETCSSCQIQSYAKRLPQER
jgi:hypothetical protein